MSGPKSKKAKSKKSVIPSGTTMAEPNFIPVVQIANMTAAAREKAKREFRRKAAGIPDA